MHVPLVLVGDVSMHALTLSHLLFITYVLRIDLVCVISVYCIDQRGG